LNILDEDNSIGHVSSKAVNMRRHSPHTHTHTYTDTPTSKDSKDLHVCGWVGGWVASEVGQLNTQKSASNGAQIV